MFQRIVILVLAGAFAGCGLLFNGGPKTVMFSSQPQGAQVFVNGVNRGTTPIAVDLPKNQNHEVEFRMQGYNSSGTTITRHVKGGIVVLDILAGLVPVIIDAATGAWYDLDDGSVHGMLQPAELEAVKRGTPADEFIDLPEEKEEEAGQSASSTSARWFAGGWMVGLLTGWSFNTLGS